MERTLILIKPDGVQRGLIGEVISRFEKRGLKLAGLKLIHMSKELAEKHYEVHQDKPFYPGLIEYIISGPVVAMAWEGSDAIKICRSTMGATNPVDAGPGTIRGDYGLEIGRNIVHGSDGPETAAFELDLYFDEDELIDWGRSTDEWVFE